MTFPGNDATTRLSEYARPSRTILHFSDTHLLGDDSLLYGVADSTGHLASALDDLLESGVRADAVVFTGDIADTGDAGAYRRIRSLVEPFTDRMGAELIWLMGNHDDRATFRRELLNEPSDTAPVDAVYDLDGLRIIAIDSTVPGHHHGDFDDAQLDWLRHIVSTPAKYGTILAMHHPPLPTVVDLAMTCELVRQDRLADAIAGTDVRTIIAGHVHHSAFGTFHGIPVSAASATCYTQDLTVAPGGLRSHDTAQGFNLIHVHEDTILHSVAGISRGRIIDAVTPEEAAEQLTAAGIIIRPPHTNQA